MNKQQCVLGKLAADQPQFVCPLNQVRAGTAVRIKQLAASPELIQRLRELGMGEEQEIRLLCRQASVICQVCNARLGLSEELAGSIMVEPLPHPPNATPA